MTLHALEPTLATLHGHFSRELPPVLTIASGDRVRFRTLDVRWGRFEHDQPFEAAEAFPGRDLERDPGHALCGPVWIEGARAGMALEVRVISLRVGRPDSSSTWRHRRAVQLALGSGTRGERLARLDRRRRVQHHEAEPLVGALELAQHVELINKR